MTDSVRTCVQHGGTVWSSPFLCDQSYEIAPGMRDACWSRAASDDGRFCAVCGADVVGNDPHAPWCRIGLGDPNEPIQ